MKSTTIVVGTVLLLLVGTDQRAGAQRQPDLLASNIDPSVSPADDFFQYATGGWFRRNPVPAAAGKWGISEVVGADIASQLQRINEDAAAQKASRGSAEQLVGDFWFTGMDAAARERQGLNPLQPDFERIERIRSIRDLTDVVAVFHQRNQFVGSTLYTALFVAHPEQDEKDSNRWVFSLRQGGISMSPGYYSGADPPRARVREAFRAYLVKVFSRLQGSADKARASADAVYELESELASAFDQEPSYRRMSVAELSRLAPAIDWPRYLQRVGAARVRSIVMRDPGFYKRLDSLLTTTSLETWKDYLRLWLVTVNNGFLDDAASADYFSYDRLYTGAQAQAPVSQRVLRQEQRLLGQPLAKLYLQRYFPAPVKTRREAVAASLRTAFRQRIEHLDWMGASTKAKALQKLDRLQVTIGLPEKGIDFSTMVLRRDSYVLNEIRAHAWARQIEMKRLNARVDRTAGDPETTLGEAYYDVTLNQLFLGPGSVLNAPGWRDEDLDDAFVYASTALGHEMSHAFDSEGREYDADGNKVDWWTTEDDAAFRQRAQILVDEYDGFTLSGGQHVDGRRTLPENMADLVGLRISLDAFKTTDEFRKNERIGGFTPLQRFFLAYAYGNMERTRNETVGNYAPSRLRVNGAVMNIPEFYEAFDVKPGDRMYRPEDKRVNVW